MTGKTPQNRISATAGQLRRLCYTRDEIPEGEERGRKGRNV